jgi:N-sulfoglucosamine sulfohydrolase
LAEKAVAYLEDPRRKHRPFYLEVGFFEPHRPYDWGGAQPDDSNGVEVPPYLPDAPESRIELAALQGMIRRVDDAVGVILRALAATGLEQDTWVIFTTDHGLAMPRAKATLYDPGLETALIMRCPGAGLTGGQRYAEMISHVDVVPTLLEGVGLAPPGNLQGRSFWPLLRGDGYVPNEHIFAEKTFHQAYEPMRGVRTLTHKLVVNFEIDTAVNVPDDVRSGLIYPLMAAQLTGMRDHLELYDLRADPGETVNLAGQPDYAETENALKQTLLNWMQVTDDPLLAGPVGSPYRAKALARLTGDSTTPDEGLYGRSSLMRL